MNKLIVAILVASGAIFFGTMSASAAGCDAGRVGKNLKCGVEGPKHYADPATLTDHENELNRRKAVRGSGACVFLPFKGGNYKAPAPIVFAPDSGAFCTKKQASRHCIDCTAFLNDQKPQHVAGPARNLPKSNRIRGVARSLPNNVEGAWIHASYVGKVYWCPKISNTNATYAFAH